VYSVVADVKTALISNNHSNENDSFKATAKFEFPIARRIDKENKVQEDTRNNSNSRSAIPAIVAVIIVAVILAVSAFALYWTRFESNAAFTLYGFETRKETLRL